MTATQESQDVLVIGGGLVGLCTAYYLNAAGYAVRVLERREGVGLETSFANAGMATPSMSDPWNAPGVHRDLIRYLGRKDAPMLLRPGAVWQYLGWGLRFLRFATPERFDAAMRANFELSAYSVGKLVELRAELGLDYEGRSNGTLKVFRDQSAFDKAVADSEKLKEFGLEYRVLDRAGAVATEPVLKGNAENIAGALHNVGDRTGDAHLFCRELAGILEERGVHVDRGTAVERIWLEGGEVLGVQTKAGPIQCRRIVVAAAAWSPALLRGTGLTLPIKPVKGYSVTAEMLDASLMPRMSIIDHEMHAAVTPFNTRIRMAGTAEFAGWNRHLDTDRLANLWRLAETVNPQMAAAADRRNATDWCGFRPMSADGVPYIGSTGIAGLYVNTGQGYLGWTQAAGSGHALAELISGRAPDLDLHPYRVDRR